MCSELNLVKQHCDDGEKRQEKEIKEKVNAFSRSIYLNQFDSHSQ